MYTYMYIPAKMILCMCLGPKIVKGICIMSTHVNSSQPSGHTAIIILNVIKIQSFIILYPGILFCYIIVS